MQRYGTAARPRAGMSYRGADERMDKIQGLGIRQAARVSSRESATLTEFGGQVGVLRDVENHPASLIGAPKINSMCAEVSVYKLGDVFIEVCQASGQFLSQPLEYLADILIKSRLDNLGRPLILLLEGLAALGNLVAKSGNFARDLVKRAGAAVNVAKIILELKRERRHHKFRRVGPWFVQDVVRRVEHPAE